MTVVKMKQVKSTKKCVLKRKLNFENYKNCLEATQLQNKINYLEKNEKYHKQFMGTILISLCQY